MRAPVLSARFVVRRGARAMAAEIAGRNTFVVCARWSKHCATDHDVNSMLVEVGLAAAAYQASYFWSYVLDLIQYILKLPI